MLALQCKEGERSKTGCTVPIKMGVVGMKMEMCALDLAVVSQGVEKLGKEIGQELALVTIKIRFEVLRE